MVCLSLANNIIKYGRNSISGYNINSVRICKAMNNSLRMGVNMKTSTGSPVHNSPTTISSEK